MTILLMLMCLVLQAASATFLFVLGYAVERGNCEDIQLNVASLATLLPCYLATQCIE